MSNELGNVPVLVLGLNASISAVRFHAQVRNSEYRLQQQCNVGNGSSGNIVETRNKQDDELSTQWLHYTDSQQ